MGLLRRILLLGVGLAAVTARAFGAEATLVADAHVNSALPGVNSGAISNLNVGGGYTALLQFDLSTLPAGVMAAQVTRATLRLYCNRMNTAGVVSVQPVGGAWGEYSITYASLPALGAATQVVQISQAGVFVAVDVTALVQGWINSPATNNGVALTAGTAAVQFDSKENDLTGHAAALDITLAAVGPAGPQGSQGLPGAQGPQGYGGVMGLQGPQGFAGPQGAPGPAGALGPQGPAGPIGAAGPVGAAGATGLQGSPGMVYRGPYASATNYALGDVVLWQGSSYTSLRSGNLGNTPSASPAGWGVLSPQGDAGPAGPQGLSGVAGAQGLPGSVGPNGPAGPQGVQGIPGQAGGQGSIGPVGGTGAAGPTGPQGVAGPVGMTFRGVYSAAVNYALADGVTYGGGAYVSLIAGNHGNSPDANPAAWAMFATGAAGAQGPAGVAGPQGVMGPQGPTGATGSQGVAGAVGPQGPAVANYTGNYVSSTNYALHDAVSFGGSTYISLAAGNRGNTPDASPAQWALLAAQGPAGPAGVTGPGGPVGAAGPAGVPGAIGPQGPPVSFAGGWLVGTAYPVGSAVSYGGSSYIALAANAGRQPDVNPTYWGVLAQSGAQGQAGPAGATGMQGPTGFAGAQGVAGPAGPTGATGAIGSAGAIGPAGPQGALGSTGAAGPAGLVYRGSYSSSTNYGLNDAVSYLGSSYISLLAGNRGNSPDQSPTSWSALAVQGSAGSAGAAGMTGAQGPQGPSGPQGVAGAQGAAGAVGVTSRGGWTASAAYRANDVALFGGTSYLATAASTGAEPDLSPGLWAALAADGSAGATGPAGAAASITVGTVTTGVPGTAAAVSNTGTASAAVLNFTIPQGAAGANGTGGGGGGAGTSGIPFASTYHAVSYLSKYYSVNNANSALTETDSMLTWIPGGCNATQLMVFSHQGNAITVTLRQGTPTGMADTVLACALTAGASCTATGDVAIAPGNFVDYSITGSNGNSAGVWTVLACN